MNAYGYSLCITDTKGSHADLTADYAAIPTEMKAVASYFGKEVLLGLTIEDILSHAQELREKLVIAPYCEPCISYVRMCV